MDHTSIASQSQAHVQVQSKIDEFFGRFKIANLMHQCGVRKHHGGGSISFFGFRFSAHIEGRLFHDSTKSWRDFSSYNGMVSISTSYANNYDSDPCNNAGVYGINAEVGFDQLLTNANSYNQIIGDSDSAGFSAGWKSGVDMEVSIMQKNGKDLTLQNGNTIFELSGGLPLYGRNYGLEGHNGVKGHTTGFLGFDFSQ